MIECSKLHTKINFRLREIRKNRFLNFLAMIATGLQFEDRLDGAVNFSLWKARIVLILQDSELWDIVNNQPDGSSLRCSG